MLAVLLTVHMIACVALVIAVMLQRSEGGALGMGGGGTGGLISGRGAASALVRTTMVLAGVFFVTSITMTALNSYAQKSQSSLEKATQQEQSKPLDPLSAPRTSLTLPSTGTMTPPASTPAPAPADPLAPNLTAPSGSTTTAPTTQAPAATTPATPPASTPAPAPAAPKATTPAAPKTAAPKPATQTPVSTPAPGSQAPATQEPATPQNGGSPNP